SLGRLKRLSFIDISPHATLEKTTFDLTLERWNSLESVYVFTETNAVGLINHWSAQLQQRTPRRPKLKIGLVNTYIREDPNQQILVVSAEVAAHLEWLSLRITTEAELSHLSRHF